MAEKPYKQMTDEAVKAAVKAICRQCEKFETDEEANKEVERLILEELDYQGPVAITSTSTRSGRWVMRMFMLMMYGPSGNVIHI